MIKTIKECIEYAYEKEFLDFGNYMDLKEEIEDLYKDQEELTNIKLYGEEESNENQNN